ncbi:dienelactone hydrolase [Nitritalea halalkaliphila LW7]|uniref:Dienelactone hydrolase n=1 Tax=Nitritalea halalkaliphila LW7 TaxID=1189621 RepID=I5C5P4_9BACT|nr:dienelactone hydrolase family protein [Nitritalea halalkaliphila]EIM77146.1 dienelactone hydrolase [Nitritalea halalkaliphila LW7]
MEKTPKPKLPQEVYDLYDYYVHGQLNRRQFMDKLSRYTVGGLSIAALSSYLMPDYIGTKRFQEDDPRIESQRITYTSPDGGGEIQALLVLPKERSGPLPTLLVVHENRGLNPYIEDTAKQAALDGFIALAPDMLSPFGGYPGNDDEGRRLQAQRNRDEMLSDFIAGHQLLADHEAGNGKVGVIGFCFGAWIANNMAVKLPNLAAAVPFYGGQPEEQDVAAIQAPLQLHYAELDTRVNAGWPAYETALKRESKTYEVHFYPEANHGFHNHSTPRYDEPSAKLAWERSVAFLKKHVG